MENRGSPVLHFLCYINPVTPFSIFHEHVQRGAMCGSHVQVSFRHLTWQGRIFGGCTINAVFSCAQKEKACDANSLCSCIRCGSTSQVLLLGTESVSHDSNLSWRTFWKADPVREIMNSVD